MKPQELEKRNRKEFDTWAKIYDWPIFKLGFRKSYKSVEKNLPNLKKKKLLSIACGTATLEIYLAKKYKNAEIFCVDQSEEMLQHARMKAKGIKNIVLTQANANKLPFHKDFFDIAICLNAFHHFPYQDKSLQEVNRVLKNNGLFYYADQIKDGFIRRLSAEFNDFFERGVFHYTIDELLIFFRRNKFTIQKIEKHLRGALVIGKK
ncbi:MAG: class I SAM-dependent methyltransferase [Candidatus Levyibacteriota bacterium]